MGKVAQIPKNHWFFSITQKDTKIIYIQKSDCSMENSEIRQLAPEQITYIQKEANELMK